MSLAWSEIPLGLWIILSSLATVALLSVFVAWRSNVNTRRDLKDQSERTWQQSVRQLKYEADQRAKQRVHDSEEATALRAHDAEQAARAREAALRQTVFLEASEALLQLHLLLGRMGDAQSDERELWVRFEANLANLMPVHMIATGPTVETVMGYVNEVVPGFLELAMLRRLRPGETASLRSSKDTSELLRGLFGADAAPLPVVDDESETSDAGSPVPSLADEKRLKVRLQQLEQQEGLDRRTANLTSQSGKLLAASLLAIRHEMGGTLDDRRYDQLWQVLSGKTATILKQNMESAKLQALDIRSMLS